MYILAVPSEREDPFSIRAAPGAEEVFCLERPGPEGLKV